MNDHQIYNSGIYNKIVKKHMISPQNLQKIYYFLHKNFWLPAKEELQPLPAPYRGVQPVMKEEDEKQTSLMNYADFSTIDLQHDLSYYDDLLGG